MTAPTEDEVMALLTRVVGDLCVKCLRCYEYPETMSECELCQQREHDARVLTALLDEARKDSERLDWLEARDGISINPRVHESGIKYTHLTYFRDDRRGQQYVQGPASLRAAIDFARGV